MDILAGKTAPCCLSTDVLFAPVLSDRHAGAGTEISAAKDVNTMKGKWLVSWESIISIFVPEKLSMADG